MYDYICEFTRKVREMVRGGEIQKLRKQRYHSIFVLNINIILYCILNFKNEFVSLKLFYSLFLIVRLKCFFLRGELKRNILIFLPLNKK